MIKDECHGAEIEKDVLTPILQRAVSFLNDDMKIRVVSQSLQVICPKKVELKKNTSMIGTGGSIQVIITMSYEDALLEELVKAFLEGEEAAEDEMDEIRESVSSEFVNTVVGNALSNPFDGTTLTITPPVLIYEAKSLFRHKSSAIAAASITTSFGDILLTVIGPKESFADTLQFKEL
ncbi:chemotaxis protein CheX [bacterium]|nr:chemotaxis protein CheX [bacterium]